MFGELKAFLLRGNIVELAVAFVLGLAFAAVVTSFVEDIINPIIGAIFGNPDFTEMTIELGDAELRYGAFITALINFVLVGIAIFLFVVKPVGAYMARRAAEEAVTTRECPECLAEIPNAATRCQFCGVQVEPATVEPVTSGQS